MYPTDIRPLTSLRIVAALWVLIYHFRLHLGVGLDRIGFVAKGYLGVDLFFILSGFILSHVYLARLEDKRLNYGSFLWARLARVYPVHLVTLGATILLWQVAVRAGATFDPLAFDPAVLPQHLLLIHAWGTTPMVQWNFPSWSISAEWFAYICFPVAAFAVLALGREPWVAASLALCLFFAAFWVLKSYDLPIAEVTRLGFIRIIPAFLFGVALYQLGRTLRLPAWAGWVGTALALSWVAIATTLRLSDAVTWPSLGLLIFSLAEISKTSPKGTLDTAAFVYLGEVSYSVYMTHLPIDIAYFHGLGRIAPDLSVVGAWVGWIGVFFVILITSMLTYHLVEQPARNWLRGRDPFNRKPPLEPSREPVL